MARSDLRGHAQLHEWQGTQHNAGKYLHTQDLTHLRVSLKRSSKETKRQQQLQNLFTVYTTLLLQVSILNLHTWFEKKIWW